jgi:hypothetical protein
MVASLYLLPPDFLRLPTLNLFLGQAIQLKPRLAASLVFKRQRKAKAMQTALTPKPETTPELDARFAVALSFLLAHLALLGVVANILHSSKYTADV